LFGCKSVETTGSYNEKLTNKTPYFFTYNSNDEKTIENLKKNLLPEGFSLVNEETYASGGSYVFEKTLSDDEKFETTGVFEAITGTSTGTQKGRLVFVVSRTDGNLVVEMTPRIVATTQQYSEYDSSSEAEETQVPQGHPLPMKYGRMLAQLNDWELKSPRRKQVFVNGNATATAEAQKSEEAETESERQQSDLSKKQSTEQDERPGEGGEDVAWVQKTLKELGHDCGTVDGVMGPNTRSCIRDFQRSKNLPVSGRMDETTYRQVLAVLRGKDAEEKPPAADGPSSEKTVADESSSDEAPSRSDEALSMPDGAPSEEVLRRAIVALIEEGEVPEAVKRTMSGSCVDGNVKNLTIRAVGRESKLLGKTYWPVKTLVTGSCTQNLNCGPDSIYGPCETLTFDRKKVEFGVRQDPYGDWVARTLSR